MNIVQKHSKDYLIAWGEWCKDKMAYPQHIAKVEAIQLARAEKLEAK
jgi:hypothetical protein